MVSVYLSLQKMPPAYHLKKSNYFLFNIEALRTIWKKVITLFNIPPPNITHGVGTICVPLYRYCRKAKKKIKIPWKDIIFPRILQLLLKLTAVIRTDRIQLCYLIFSHSCKLNRFSTLRPSSARKGYEYLLYYSYLLLPLIILASYETIAHYHFSLTRHSCFLHSFSFRL